EATVSGICTLTAVVGEPSQPWDTRRSMRACSPAGASAGLAVTWANAGPATSRSAPVNRANVRRAAEDNVIRSFLQRSGGMNVADMAACVVLVAVRHPEVPADACSGYRGGALVAAI